MLFVLNLSLGYFIKSSYLLGKLIVEASVNRCFFFNFVRCIIFGNDRVRLLVLFSSGCDQMTCARFKEVSHLRIFRPKKLLVIFISGFLIIFRVCVFYMNLLAK